MLHKIQNIRNLTNSTYIIRLDRNNFDFRAGQYLSLGIPDDINMREYSIYSGVNDPYLEVLIKEIKQGDVSVVLKKSHPGQALHVSGPYGFFTLPDQNVREKKFLFLASGTGISPFHSFVKSYPTLDYKIIHGIRYNSETYEKESYSAGNYFAAVSQDNKAKIKGRLTEYLKTLTLEPSTLCYLCGNVDMIHDAYEILQSKGIPVDQIHSEVYF